MTDATWKFYRIHYTVVPAGVLQLTLAVNRQTTDWNSSVFLWNLQLQLKAVCLMDYVVVHSDYFDHRQRQRYCTRLQKDIHRLESYRNWFWKMIRKRESSNRTFLIETWRHLTWQSFIWRQKVIFEWRQYYSHCFLRWSQATVTKEELWIVDQQVFDTEISLDPFSSFRTNFGRNHRTFSRKQHVRHFSYNKTIKLFVFISFWMIFV